MQSDEPLVSIVVIAYNEGKRLASCLWSLSDLQTSYPIEILGVNNNSKDNTEDVYTAFGVKYFNETRQSHYFARQCGLFYRWVERPRLGRTRRRLSRRAHQRSDAATVGVLYTVPRLESRRLPRLLQRHAR